MEFAVEGFRLEKTFARRRPLGELLRHPFRRPEKIRALRGVDLQVRPGEIFGLLGPNGAGKTTLLKILCCLVLPDAGRATIHGHETTHEKRVKPLIGLVNTDERSFYWRLSGRENLRFFAVLYDVPRESTETRIGELLELVDMSRAADQRFAEYSAGMKQRLAIARALLHDPPVLMMDEPTRSLDPAASLHLRSFIGQELRTRAAKTIVLATHNLAEADSLCDRLAILVEGRIRETGTPAEIRGLGLKERRYRIELSGAQGPLTGPFRVVGDEMAAGRRRLTVTLEDDAGLDDLLRGVIGAGASVLACDRVEHDLEEAFTRILARESGSR